MPRERLTVKKLYDKIEEVNNLLLDVYKASQEVEVELPSKPFAWVEFLDGLFLGMVAISLIWVYWR
jgi:hypothetical protein